MRAQGVDECVINGPYDYHITRKSVSLRLDSDSDRDLKHAVVDTD